MYNDNHVNPPKTPSIFVTLGSRIVGRALTDTGKRAAVLTTLAVAITDEGVIDTQKLNAQLCLTRNNNPIPPTGLAGLIWTRKLCASLPAEKLLSSMGDHFRYDRKEVMVKDIASVLVYCRDCQ